MSARGLASIKGPQPVAEPIRVMLVDDSGVSRAIMGRWLEESGEAVVAASASNGRAALETLARTPIDVMILDIEMPELDGLSALPQLLTIQPGLQVLMASTLTLRNARISLEALRLGAADTIGKPRAGWATSGGLDFRTELLMKVRALGEAAQRFRRQRPLPRPAAPRMVRKPAPVAAIVRQEVYAPRTASRVRPAAVVIGASTGGPNALFRLFEMLPRELHVPVLITQHMPPTFTTILAEHLARHTGRPAMEAEDGTPLRPGHIYVAPGDRHMSVAGPADKASIRLDDGPHENFCRPSVNPLMRSAAQVFGPATLGVMLTGMGSDGLDGVRDLVKAGGTMLVQDQATSVVWGMPGAVARAGLATEVLGLDALGAAVARQLERRS